MRIIGRTKDGFMALMSEVEVLALIGSRRVLYDKSGNPYEGRGDDLIDTQIDVLGRLKPLERFEIERAGFAVHIGGQLRHLADEADRVVGELGPEAPKPADPLERGLKP
jgi:hypothetical protein